jgi:hypothetical protein
MDASARIHSYDRRVGTTWSRDDLVDWTLAVAVAIGAVLQQRDCGCRVEPLWLNVAVLLLVTLPIGLRRRWPIPVLLLTGGASLLHVLLGFTNQFLGTFAVLVALFSVASYAAWPLSVVGAAAIGLGLPVNFVVDWSNRGHVAWADVPYNYALFGAAWILATTCGVNASGCGQLSASGLSTRMTPAGRLPMSERASPVTCMTQLPTSWG